jgi:hypothetical protein
MKGLEDFLRLFPGISLKSRVLVFALGGNPAKAMAAGESV